MFSSVVPQLLPMGITSMPLLCSNKAAEIRSWWQSHKKLDTRDELAFLDPISVSWVERNMVPNQMKRPLKEGSQRKGSQLLIKSQVYPRTLINDPTFPILKSFESLSKGFPGSGSILRTRSRGVQVFDFQNHGPRFLVFSNLHAKLDNFT